MIVRPWNELMLCLSYTRAFPNQETERETELGLEDVVQNWLSFSTVLPSIPSTVKYSIGEWEYQELFRLSRVKITSHTQRFRYTAYRIYALWNFKATKSIEDFWRENRCNVRWKVKYVKFTLYSSVLWNCSFEMNAYKHNQDVYLEFKTVEVNKNFLNLRRARIKRNILW